MTFDYQHATPDEIRAEAARRRKEREIPIPVTQRVRRPVAPVIAPVEFFIPWSCLVADNAKYMAAKRANGKLALILTPAYRAAKAQMEKLAHAAMDGRDPFEGHLLVRATMHEPDQRTRRDPINYAKATHDAMSKIVYRDDSQITMAWWIRGDPNIDRPGLHVWVAPITTDNSEG